MYAPDEGRWKGVDALGEKFYSWSPYNYVMGNPVIYIDPDGNSPGLALRFGRVLVRISIRAARRVASGERTMDAPMQALKGEMRSVAYDLRTLNSSELSPEAGRARRRATLDLLIGTDLNTNADLSVSEPSYDYATDDTEDPVKLGTFLEGDDVSEAREHAEEVGVIEGVIDRKGTKERRKENLKGVDPEDGKDRDEYPPAVIKPKDGSNVSVKPINPSHNRRSGSRLRYEIEDLPDGTPVRIDPFDLKKE